MNKKELIFQQILDLALEEGKKIIDKYLKEHEQDTYWSVCLGDVHIVGDSEFAVWYRQKMNTDIIENQGGFKYEGAMAWASKVQSVLSSFGIETRNDIHLD